MNATKLISTFFKPRQKAIARYATQAEALQDKVLRRLLNDAADTEWGKMYDYKDMKGYADLPAAYPSRHTRKSKATWNGCDVEKRTSYGTDR